MKNKKTILLVEDDPFLTDIYQKKLKSSGFEVLLALDGEKAFEALAEKPVDLVLLDIVLPKMEGWTVISKIKENEKWKNIKVVFLSNLSQKEEVDKGMKLGADRYLIKAQYTPSQVVKEIKALLNQ